MADPIPVPKAPTPTPKPKPVPAVTQPTYPRDVVLPYWIGTTDPSGQLRPGQTSAYQRGSEPQSVQAQTLAEDAVVPIIYGGPERVAGMPYTVCLTPDGQRLVVAYILCEGEIQSISNYEINDGPQPDGFIAQGYLGTQTQNVDPTLAACIPGFNENLRGTAYIVASYANTTIKGWPKLTVLVNALKIPDGRAGDALGAWDNPALILAHFMRTYGRRVVNQPSVNAAANFCDAMVGTIKRARLTITIAEARDVDDWIEVLRGYIPAWVNFRDGQWFIDPDQPGVPVLDYDADTDARLDGDGPMVLYKRGARDAPNVVEVSYTETGITPWTTRKAVASLSGLGNGQRRRASLSLPGIRSYAQAYRFAVERLNHYTLETIEGDVSVMDDGVQIVPGDLVTITDSAFGWAVKTVRVLRVDESDSGRWALRFREYNETAYSSADVASPSPPIVGTLPNPTTVAAITGLAAVESLKFENATLATGSASKPATGLVWQSRIEATWDPSTDPFLDHYEIALKGDPLTQPSVSQSGLAVFSSAPVVQGTSYTLQVRAVNTLGFVSAWASVVVAVLGKTTPPGDVTILDFAAEVGGEVILRWRAVPEPDIVRYEWRGLATTATTAPWDSMTLLDRPDTNYTRIKGIAPGATLFAVKAIDSVGRYSVNPLYVNVVITSDASSFLQSYDFTPQLGTSTNIRQQDFPIVEGSTARPLPRWISQDQTVWDAAMPNPVASANAPVVIAWGRNAAFKLACDQYDFGLTLEATVNVNCAWITATRGNPTLYVLNSVDGTTWDNTVTIPLAAGVTLGWKAVKVTARFVRLEIWSNANTDAVMVEGKINVQIASESRKESGTGTSLASGALRVNLAQKYSKAVSITITPKGTTFASPAFDNVIVGLGVTPNSFDAYIFNSSAAQISRDFAWTFAGV